MNELSYSLGVSVGMNLKDQGFEVDSVNDFAQALGDVLGNKELAIEPERINKIVNDYFTSLQEKRYAEKIQEGKDFLEKNRLAEGVVELESGLQYRIIKNGTGNKPKENDQVTVHYEGKLIDGTVFDSSYSRNEPATFPVNGVIKGWIEALQLMEVGASWELFIPSNLAYGERGAGNVIGPHSTLIFKVELLNIA